MNNTRCFVSTSIACAFVCSCRKHNASYRGLVSFGIRQHWCGWTNLLPILGLGPWRLGSSRVSTDVSRRRTGTLEPENPMLRADVLNTSACCCFVAEYEQFHFSGTSDLFCFALEGRFLAADGRSLDRIAAGVIDFSGRQTKHERTGEAEQILADLRG